MQNKGLIVLSLFDGAAIGRLALERAGIPVARYFAAEIDPFAIRVARKNWPDIVHVGDVRRVRGADLPKIDLVLAGPPCQDLSVSGRRLGLEGARSSLFWEVDRLIKETLPGWFLVENVVPADKQDAVTINRTLDVEPVKIDSALVSAQRRARYYWTNFPGTEPTLFGFKIPQPADRGIILQDVLDTGHSPLSKSYCIDANYSKGGSFAWAWQSSRRMMVFEKAATSIRLGTIKGKNQQQNRVYSVRGKSVAIKGSGGGAGANTGLYAVPVPPSNAPKRALNGVLFHNTCGGGGGHS